MGMFDTVHIICPTCKHKIEIQTKAGRCNLLRYHSDNVPADIAMSLNKREETCACGATIQIKAIVPRVKLTVTTLEDIPEWD